MVSGWQDVPSPSGWHVALEVHLPEQVRRFLLEAPIRLPGRAGRWDDAPMPTQDQMHRRDGGNIVPVARKAARDLARPPNRVGIAHRQHQGLGRRLAATRTPMRPARAIRQRGVACREPA
jgi:hypothetical protein